MTIHHHHEPVIVLYENLDQNPLFVQLKERARRDVWTYTTEYPPMDRDFLCRRYDWNIPMDLFQWNWYILPRQINAGMCGGECRFPLTGHFNATNYSFLKSWYHQATRHDYTELIPTACCTPFEYHPLSVMYITNLLEVRVKQMPEMRVASCACRQCRYIVYNSYLKIVDSLSDDVRWRFGRVVYDATDLLYVRRVQYDLDYNEYVPHWPLYLIILGYPVTRLSTKYSG